MLTASAVLAADDAPVKLAKERSLGFPLGIYADDSVVGVQYGFELQDGQKFRFDMDVILEHARDSLIFAPAIGRIFEEPITDDFRFYSGLFVVLLQSSAAGNTYLGVKGFAGLEYFTRSDQSFFCELGGGGAFADRSKLNATQGVSIAGGTRLYF